MAIGTQMRRNADGALALDFYRCRARRLRRIAQRRAWLAILRRLGKSWPKGRGGEAMPLRPSDACITEAVGRHLAHQKQARVA